MARPTNKSLLILAGFCVCATPALAESEDVLKHYKNNPYYDEMSRSDFIALNAGDAPQSNITIHAEEVWPSYVNDTHFHTDGVDAEKIMVEFHKRRATPPKEPSSAPLINLNNFPPPTP